MVENDAVGKAVYARSERIVSSRFPTYFRIVAGPDADEGFYFTIPGCEEGKLTEVAVHVLELRNGLKIHRASNREFELLSKPNCMPDESAADDGMSSLPADA